MVLPGSFLQEGRVNGIDLNIERKKIFTASTQDVTKKIENGKTKKQSLQLCRRGSKISYLLWVFLVMPRLGSDRPTSSMITSTPNMYLTIYILYSEMVFRITHTLVLNNTAFSEMSRLEI